MIFTFSSRSGADVQGWWFPGGDKVAHLAVFGVLSLLLFVACYVERGFAPVKAACFAILLTGLYGASDEMHQGFVASRDCDLLDWTADVGGATLAVLPALWWTHRK